MSTHEAFLKFLDKADDRAFTKEFNKNPQKKMHECGLNEDEACAVDAAGRHRGKGKKAQTDAIKKMFKDLGLDPEEHKNLIDKLVDNYEAAW
ncbi:hypothetical protein [Sorangium sp. So ce406]|uniref:hypothetical protein n=1 Tax=Sorangium sp. So ce406 TaxID=3133311 RepID=UPI003F5ADF09